MSITPKNWNAFQHYKDRSPAWIKLHRGLLHDFAFSRLPVASRALAPMLWLLASEYEAGNITGEFEEVAYKLHMTKGEFCEALNPLIESGFFILDSTALADCKQEASPEKRDIEDIEKTEERRAAVAADPRADLFGRGLKALAGMTGKTPDSCRSLVGRWLKTVDDEAIQVLGAIDDAERNRVADPVGWITKSLQPRSRNGQANPNSVVAAQQKLIDKIAEFGPRPSLIRGSSGENIVRMLPQGGRERPGDVHGGDNGDPGGIPGGDNPARHGPEDGDSPKN